MIEFIHRADPPRVLVISTRLHDSHPARCLKFEFEDLIAQVDAADIVGLRGSGSGRGSAARMLSRLDRLGLCPRSIGAAREIASPRRYDLLFFYAMTLRDLVALAPLRSYLDLAHTTACHVEELWMNTLEGRSGELAILRRFDHVSIGCEASVDAVSEAIGKPCAFMAPSVDTMVFAPSLPLPEPGIDMYAMGRRRPEVHDMLLRFARERKRFYMFNTMGGMTVKSHVAHRAMLAETIRRSRYFMVDIARGNERGALGGQEEIGYRYFEGAAAGTIMVGASPRSRSFGKLFGWEEAVIDLPAKPEQAWALFQALDGDPARRERVRAANVAGSLRQHDGAHRWASLLARVGMDPLPALVERRQALSQRAAAFERLSGRLRDGDHNDTVASSLLSGDHSADRKPSAPVMAGRRKE